MKIESQVAEKILELAGSGKAVMVGRVTGSEKETVSYVSQQTGQRESRERVLLGLSPLGPGLANTVSVDDVEGALPIPGAVVALLLTSLTKKSGVSIVRCKIVPVA